MSNTAHYLRSAVFVAAVTAVCAALVALVSDGGGTLYLRDGTPVTVDYGPLWLARLAYQPPPWVGILLKAVVVLLATGVAIGYYRHGIDDATVRQLTETASVLVAVFFVAHGVSGLPWLPYWAGAVSGGVGGWLLGKGVFVGFERVFDGPNE